MASKLREWIPFVTQAVDPWVSKHDIDAGARWGQELELALEGAKFGVICLTRENLKAEWLHFEAGAISKTVIDKRTMVCPYLIDLEPSDIPPGPFTQFQAKRANREETYELVLAINKASDAGLTLAADKLRISFEKWWSELDTFLKDELPSEGDAPRKRRPPEEVAEEILDIVRELSRRLSHYTDPRWFSESAFSGFSGSPGTRPIPIESLTPVQQRILIQELGRRRESARLSVGSFARAYGVSRLEAKHLLGLLDGLDGIIEPAQENTAEGGIRAKPEYRGYSGFEKSEEEDPSEK